MYSKPVFDIVELDNFVQMNGSVPGPPSWPPRSLDFELYFTDKGTNNDD